MLIYKVNRYLISSFSNAMCSPQVRRLSLIVGSGELYFVIVLALLNSLAPIRTYIKKKR